MSGECSSCSGAPQTSDFSTWKGWNLLAKTVRKDKNMKVKITSLWDLNSSFHFFSDCGFLNLFSGPRK